MRAPRAAASSIMDARRAARRSCRRWARAGYSSRMRRNWRAVRMPDQVARDSAMASCGGARAFSATFGKARFPRAPRGASDQLQDAGGQRASRSRRGAGSRPGKMTRRPARIRCRRGSPSANRPLSARLQGAAVRAECQKPQLFVGEPVEQADPRKAADIVFQRHSVPPRTGLEHDALKWNRFNFCVPGSVAHG